MEQLKGGAQAAHAREPDLSRNNDAAFTQA